MTERGLIIFDDEQIVGFFGFDDIAGTFSLGVHRVSSDDSAFERKRAKQLREFGNLIGFLFDFELTKDDGFLKGLR